MLEENYECGVVVGRLRVFKTEDDITLKISDRGGGIPRRRRGKIFTYMYSTAPKVNFLLPSSFSRFFYRRFSLE